MLNLLYFARVAKNSISLVVFSRYWITDIDLTPCLCPELKLIAKNTNNFEISEK